MFSPKKKKLFIRFGIPYFDVFDPRFRDFSIPTAVRGSFSVEIKNYKKFLKENGFENNDLQKTENEIKNQAIQSIKAEIANLPFESKLPVWQMERRLDRVSAVLYKKLGARLLGNLNIVLLSLSITDVEVDRFSDGYKKLSSLTQEPLLDMAAEKGNEEIRIPKAAKKRGRPLLLALGGLLILGAAAAIILLF